MPGGDEHPVDIANGNGGPAAPAGNRRLWLRGMYVALLITSLVIIYYCRPQSKKKGLILGCLLLAFSYEGLGLNPLALLPVYTWVMAAPKDA